jgi:hypothetical protein
VGRNHLDYFIAVNGVKQGGVISPVLFVFILTIYYLSYLGLVLIVLLG